MDQERMTFLINGFLSKSLTGQENEELDSLIRMHPSLPQLLKKQDGNREVIDKALLRVGSVDTEKDLELVLTKIQLHQDSRNRTLSLIKMATVAALIIIVVVVVRHFLLSKR